MVAAPVAPAERAEAAVGVVVDSAQISIESERSQSPEEGSELRSGLAGL